jgi:FkbM family methyltransferase
MKKYLKKLFNKFGYSLIKYNSNFYGLKNTRFDLILDIGANIGDESRFYLENFPNSQVVAFEPNPIHLDSLRKLYQKYPTRFIFEMCGVGSKPEHLYLNAHSNHSPSSSFLELTNEGALTLNDFTKVDLTIQNKINVPIICLNEYLLEFDLIEKNILLKTDTQGFELEVFKGASNILKYIDVIIVELDFKRAYKKQCLPIEVINCLYSHNFEIQGFSYPPGIDKNGEILGSDFIFKKII